VRGRFEEGDEGDAKFHEAMVKDAEMASNVGVLIMPLAFAGLTTMPYGSDACGHTLIYSIVDCDIKGPKLAVRLLYTVCITCAIGFSSLGTLSAMRTGLMLGAQPPDRALALLLDVDQMRWDFFRKYYPFKAIRLAIMFLFFGVV